MDARESRGRPDCSACCVSEPESGDWTRLPADGPLRGCHAVVDNSARRRAMARLWFEIRAVPETWLVVMTDAPVYVVASAGSGAPNLRFGDADENCAAG